MGDFVTVSHAREDEANGIYTLEKQGLYKLRRPDMQSTIYFDKSWKLSLSGKTVGDQYDYEWKDATDLASSGMTWTSQSEPGATCFARAMRLGEGDQLLISINRFERKKNIGLALEAFAELPKNVRDQTKLILAGGYDKHLPENVEHA